MSRTLFENSKAALAFAAVIIVGAVSMVGTSDDGGVLPALVERLGAKPAGQASAEYAGEAGAAPAKAAVAAAPASVFGDYKGTNPSGTAPTGTGGSSSAGQVVNPMTAPLAPTAIAN